MIVLKFESSFEIVIIMRDVGHFYAYFFQKFFIQTKCKQLYVYHDIILKFHKFTLSSSFGNYIEIDMCSKEYKI